MVEQQGGAELADRRGAETFGARHLQNSIFVEIVAAEMLVDIAEHRIVLDEGNDGAAGRLGRVAGVDRIRERAGVAEIMAARDRRSVGHGEGRKQRMRVLEVDALVANLGHGRSGLLGHDLAAQAVRDEQDEVTGCGVLRRGGARGKRNQAGGQQHNGAAHRILPKEAFRREGRRFRLVSLYDRIVTANTRWSRGHKSAISRRDVARVITYSSHHPRSRGCRECRVHAAPAVSCAKNVHYGAHEHTGERKHSDIPCAMALRLTSRSPR